MFSFVTNTILLALLAARLGSVTPTTVLLVLFVYVLPTGPFGDILKCILIPLIAYMIFYHVVFVRHTPNYRAIYQDALFTLEKVSWALGRICCLDIVLEAGLYGAETLRAVMCLLVVFLAYLAKSAMLIIRYAPLVFGPTAWLLLHQVAVPCVRTALPILVHLICDIGIYGHVTLMKLWQKAAATSSMSDLLQLLIDRLSEPWPAPPGAFLITTVDDTNSKQDEPALLLRTPKDQECRVTNVMSPPKLLLRGEDRPDTLDGPLGCTDSTTAVGNKTNDEQQEDEQTASRASTEDEAPISRNGRRGVALALSSAPPPRSSIGSASGTVPLCSSTDTSFDRSTASLETNVDPLFTPSPSLLTPASSVADLTNTPSKCPETLEINWVDQPESTTSPTITSSFALPADATIQPASAVEPELPAKPKPAHKTAPASQSLADSPTHMPRDFNLPAKFSLSMSCGLFKRGVAPEPKSRPELPVKPQPSSSVKLCSCKCNLEVSPLTKQLRKLKLFSTKPKSKTANVLKKTKTAVASSTTGVLSGVEAAEASVEDVTKNETKLPSAVVPAGSTTSQAEADGTLAEDASSNSKHLSYVPSIIVNTVAKTPLLVTSSRLGPLDSLLSDVPETSPSHQLPVHILSPAALTTESDESPSYFEKGKWPEVDVNEVRRELARTGTPMMASTPTITHPPSTLPSPKAVTELDEETKALLSYCDEFGCVVDAQWTDETQRQSPDQSNAPRPKSVPDSPTSSSVESDVPRALLSPSSMQCRGETNQEDGSRARKQVRWCDEEGNSLKQEMPMRRRLAGRVAGQLERTARAARIAMRPTSILRRKGTSALV
ncbi:hypothetical protein FRC09_020785 [Ceratobasidium sp. 395]|nr:hypothetical protein FRC09_020785 [Ceratobasidium sp. 395]